MLLKPLGIAILLLILIGCNGSNVPIVDRMQSIRADALKITPFTDEHPPLSLSLEYSDPVPVPGSINTAGGEDSPFITSDGNTLYFWFTPDVALPAEKQLGDGVTGIYVSSRGDGGWGAVTRVLLQEPDKLAMDGCAFVAGEVIWFCSTREGFSGINWFTANSIGDRWENWQMVNFDPTFEVGELHISMDGRQLYFASRRAGGQGGMDIWVSQNLGGVWQAPSPVDAINTVDNEGWPALNPDGSQLWFSRNYGIWRSLKGSTGWLEPELILSPLAGEPTIDQYGNIYFVHHFYHADTMLEADIYVAYRQ